MKRFKTAYLDNLKEDIGSYLNASLADFFRFPAQRLMVYAVTFILMGIGVFGVLAIYDYSYLHVEIPLKFMGINAWHTGAHFAIWIVIVDLFAAFIFRSWGAYERRTVGKTWVIFFTAFLLGFISERTIAYKLIGLYEPGLIFRWEAAPGQREGALPMFLLITPFWLVITTAVMKLIISKQAQTEELLRVRIDSILKERMKLAAVCPQLAAQSADKNSAPTDDHLQLPTDRGVGPIHVADIGHVSAEDHYLRIYYKNSEVLKNTLVRMPLKELLIRLPEQSFVRIHRSHIVHLDQISGLKRSGQSVTLSMKYGDFKLPVSRYRLPQLLPLLDRFLDS